MGTKNDLNAEVVVPSKIIKYYPDDRAEQNAQAIVPWKIDGQIVLVHFPSNTVSSAVDSLKAISLDKEVAYTAYTVDDDIVTYTGKELYEAHMKNKEYGQRVLHQEQGDTSWDQAFLQKVVHARCAADVSSKSKYYQHYLNDYYLSFARKAAWECYLSDETMHECAVYGDSDVRLALANRKDCALSTDVSDMLVNDGDANVRRVMAGREDTTLHNMAILANDKDSTVSDIILNRPVGNRHYRITLHDIFSPIYEDETLSYEQRKQETEDFLRDLVGVSQDSQEGQTQKEVRDALQNVSVQKIKSVAMQISAKHHKEASVTVLNLPDYLDDSLHMFDGCEKIESVPGLPNDLKSSAHMFDGCEKLEPMPVIPKAVKAGHENLLAKDQQKNEVSRPQQEQDDDRSIWKKFVDKIVGVVNAIKHRTDTTACMVPGMQMLVDKSNGEAGYYDMAEPEVVLTANQRIQQKISGLLEDLPPSADLLRDELTTIHELYDKANDYVSDLGGKAKDISSLLNNDVFNTDIEKIIDSIPKHTDKVAKEAETCLQTYAVTLQTIIQKVEDKQETETVNDIAATTYALEWKLAQYIGEDPDEFVQKRYESLAGLPSDEDDIDVVDSVSESRYNTAMAELSGSSFVEADMEAVRNLG